jgi:hypothetical protein
MFPFRRETALIAPAMVWKPCRESLSPLYRFYRVTAGPHTLYVRIDGEVFSSLNDDNAESDQPSPARSVEPVPKAVAPEIVRRHRVSGSSTWREARWCPFGFHQRG